MLSVISTLMILVEIAVFIAFYFSSPKATPTLIGIFFASSNVSPIILLLNSLSTVFPFLSNTLPNISPTPLCCDNSKSISFFDYLMLQ